MFVCMTHLVFKFIYLRGSKTNFLIFKMHIVAQQLKAKYEAEKQQMTAQNTAENAELQVGRFSGLFDPCGGIVLGPKALTAALSWLCTLVNMLSPHPRTRYPHYLHTRYSHSHATGQAVRDKLLTKIESMLAEVEVGTCLWLCPESNCYGRSRAALRIPPHHPPQTQNN